MASSIGPNGPWKTKPRDLHGKRSSITNAVGMLYDRREPSAQRDTAVDIHSEPAPTMGIDRNTFSAQTLAFVGVDQRNIRRGRCWGFRNEGDTVSAAVNPTAVLRLALRAASRRVRGAKPAKRRSKTANGRASRRLDPRIAIGSRHCGVRKAVRLPTPAIAEPLRKTKLVCGDGRGIARSRGPAAKARMTSNMRAVVRENQRINFAPPADSYAA